MASRAVCLAATAWLCAAGAAPHEHSHSHRLRSPAVAARRAAFAGAPASAGAVLAGATLSAAPARPSAAIANVTVSWSGVVMPQATDWVAQYCVGAPLADWGQWEYVTASAGWASGSGAVAVIAVRSACALEFRLYRDPSPYTLLGTSNAVSWGPPAAAYQVRTAYGADAATQMTVSWTSAADGPALLMVGAAPGAYTRNVTAAPSLTYAAEELCQAPANTKGPSAWTPPGFFHHASVGGLAPGTRYYARPVQAGAVGEEISFRTAPPSDTPLRFIAYADMAVSAAPGAVETSLRVSQRLDADPDGYAFLLHVGDLGYAEGHVAIWDEWMNYIEPISSRLPYHVSIGNHGAFEGGCRWPDSAPWNRQSSAARARRRPAPNSRPAPGSLAQSTTTPRADSTTHPARARCGTPHFGMAASTAAASAACPPRAASPCLRRPTPTASFGTASMPAWCTLR